VVQDEVPDSAAAESPKAAYSPTKVQYASCTLQELLDSNSTLGNYTEDEGCLWPATESTLLLEGFGGLDISLKLVVILWSRPLVQGDRRRQLDVRVRTILSHPSINADDTTEVVAVLRRATGSFTYYTFCVTLAVPR